MESDLILYFLRLGFNYNIISTFTDGMTYWNKKPDAPDTNDQVGGPEGMVMWRPPYVRAQSVDIEMTSYALLTLAKRNDITKGWPCAKWLVSQRNAFGGFSSTQVFSSLSLSLSL